MNNKDYLFNFDEILNQMTIGMLNNTNTETITTLFINRMIPHHQAAVYMCKNLLQYTNYQPLINMANQIIEIQTRQIQQMKNILMTTSNYDNSLYDTNFYLDTFLNTTTNMITKMVGSNRNSSIDLNFISEMIPHHEGAIYMCQNLLNYNIDPRLRSIASNIIVDQTNGINKLRLLRSKL